MMIKFIERSFSKKKKNNQEKDIKMIRKIKILKLIFITNNINTRQFIIIIKNVLSQNIKIFQHRNNENTIYNPQMDRAILSRINFISLSCIFSTFA